MIEELTGVGGVKGKVTGAGGESARGAPAEEKVIAEPTAGGEIPAEGKLVGVDGRAIGKKVTGAPALKNREQKRTENKTKRILKNLGGAVIKEAIAVFTPACEHHTSLSVEILPDFSFVQSQQELEFFQQELHLKKQRKRMGNGEQAINEEYPAVNRVRYEVD